MARRKKIKTEKTGKKKKKKEGNQSTAGQSGLARPGLVLSYPWVSQRGAWSRYAVRGRGDGDSWRKRHGGHGTAQRASMRWLLD